MNELDRANRTGPSFGISTSPQQVSYRDVLQVWREADAIPEIEHAWLFDHLLPIRGDRNGPILEGWTLLSALAGQTERLRLGVLVTSNRFRPPAMLAKIAATVDIVSDGRLDFGIGAGSRPDIPTARREYEAHGLPYHDSAYAVGSLAEACTVIRRLWTKAEPFDFEGTYLHLTGAICNPKPVQHPHPPILIGGRSTATLRVVAEHADLWNIPGDDIADAVSRSTLLDRFCAEIGRDPVWWYRLSRQFLTKVKIELNYSRNSLLLAQVHLCWCLVVKSLMDALIIVKLKVSTQIAHCI
jgi:alkanesulfonate monooxygenase SsuD/methylene tetrahydromethanopterin reductase-like flavin-dependent oxidoreductase (luciferase family)